MPTHFMNIWAKFHSNTSITYGHVVSHEISVNRKQTPDGRKDGQRTDGGTTQKHDAFHVPPTAVGRWQRYKDNDNMVKFAVQHARSNRTIYHDDK